MSPLPAALLFCAAAASANFLLPTLGSWSSRRQFWRMTAVSWSPPEEAVFASRPASDACQCRLFCLADRSCSAAELAEADGVRSCRLASRRGSSMARTSALAALVRDGRAALGERCLTSDECRQGQPGAACLDGVCACAAPPLTARGRCVISDCSELKQLGVDTSGAHVLQLEPDQPLVQVFCDMETAGGGWTVFQRRRDDPEQVDFFRGWQSYRDGFGSVSGQLWLGNELIHRLAARRSHEMRVDMEDFEGNRRFAQYASFSVSNEADGYRLRLTGFTGDAGDSMGNANGMQFSSRDRDQDASPTNCAEDTRGGWWFSFCYYSNLNGLYLRRGTAPEFDVQKFRAIGVFWLTFGGYHNSLKTTEMKMRPADDDSS